MQTVLGTIDETGDYVTRAITAGTNVKVSITYECLTPGNSSVKVYLQNTNRTAANQGFKRPA
ncbi:hypothetical protein FACS189449_11790 [Alphaproteobacteria bacterium]|nr:hypothetical protein FACS189449_11790 [Alphaproteobacteria bacterium]